MGCLIYRIINIWDYQYMGFLIHGFSSVYFFTVLGAGGAGRGAGGGVRGGGACRPYIKNLTV